MTRSTSATSATRRSWGRRAGGRCWCRCRLFADAGGGGGRGCCAASSRLSATRSLSFPPPLVLLPPPARPPQKPVTFFRQVLSLCEYPALMEHPAAAEIYPPDAIAVRGVRSANERRGGAAVVLPPARSPTLCALSQAILLCAPPLPSPLLAAARQGVPGQHPGRRGRVQREQGRGDPAQARGQGAPLACLSCFVACSSWAVALPTLLPGRSSIHSTLALSLSRASRRATGTPATSTTCG